MILRVALKIQEKDSKIIYLGGYPGTKPGTKPALLGLKKLTKMQLVPDTIPSKKN
jgi:hypothetical protein